ncbi:aldo/keto reductase [Sphingomonas sp.]|uniref:aldo/keto reductase n=1 Tax=Sphingomonas sp. TaxID=28214 RepID=UPI003B0007B9
MNLSSYRPLGRSGLVVSPLALGAMTFGTERWGVAGDEARAIFDAYRDAGGNFVDTADIYAKGRSEEMLGRFIADTGARDQVVLATKFTWNQHPGNPNAGGNGRKNIHRALDASCRRLGVDYIDLYWLHFWDMVTPVEEVLLTLADLVRAGRIRYYALSDVPAWYMTRMATLAAERGLPGPIALQAQYSLVERSADYEHGPAARELGIGIVPWSPLAGGFLSGKYERAGDLSAGKGRLTGDNPLGQTPFNDRNWAILDVVKRIAGQVERSPAEVALAWAASRPGVDCVLIGASRLDQVETNIAALELSLSLDQLADLEAASAAPLAFPWSAFGAGVRRSIFGGADVPAWRSDRAG